MVFGRRCAPALAACCALLTAQPLGAEQFDGLYRISPTSDCALTGVDGGALKIEGGVFYGVESQCRMSVPVNVRDMDAVLYDMVCTGEGEEWTRRALLMTAADGGLIMLWNGFAFKYDRCPENPARGTVITSDEIGINE